VLGELTAFETSRERIYLIYKLSGLFSRSTSGVPYLEGAILLKFDERTRRCLYHALGVPRLALIRTYWRPLIEPKDCFNSLSANRLDSTMTLECIAPNHINVRPTLKDSLKDSPMSIITGVDQRTERHTIPALQARTGLP
jgi:hypothetical protein